MESTAAQERAGDVGTKLATNLAEKIKETIDGLPMATAEQRSAIASLLCEDLENYAEEQLT